MGSGKNCMPKPVNVYAWRNAILSAKGPKNPIARLILLAVAQHMKADGTGAWPSQAHLVVRTGAGLRSVKRHLDFADHCGWVHRVLVRRNGKKWGFTQYEATVPDGVYDMIAERPWESDPTWRRCATGATVAPDVPRDVPRDVPSAPIKVPNGTRRGATQSARGAKSSIYEVPQWHTNSSENSPKNSPEEGALTRTALAGKIALKAEKATKEGGESPAARTERIAKTLAKFPEYTAAEIAKLTRTTAAEVLQYRGRQA